MKSRLLQEPEQITAVRFLPTSLHFLCAREIIFLLIMPLRMEMGIRWYIPCMRHIVILLLLTQAILPRLLLLLILEDILLLMRLILVGLQLVLILLRGY